MHEPGRGSTEQRHVEGAAAQVVHQQQCAVLHRRRRCVVECRRRRLRDEFRALEPDIVERMPEQAQLIAGPVRRVRHRHPIRCRTNLFGHRVEHPLGHQRGQPVRVIRRTGKHHRRRVTQPTFELSGHPVRVHRTAARRRAPNSNSLAVAKTTDGTAVWYVPNEKASTLSPRMMAAAVYVVPTSIPRTYGNRQRVAPPGGPHGLPNLGVGRVAGSESRSPATGCSARRGVSCRRGLPPFQLTLRNIERFTSPDHCHPWKCHSGGAAGDLDVDAGDVGRVLGQQEGDDLRHLVASSRSGAAGPWRSSGGRPRPGRRRSTGCRPRPARRPGCPTSARDR